MHVLQLRLRRRAERDVDPVGKGDVGVRDVDPEAEASRTRGGSASGRIQ